MSFSKLPGPMRLSAPNNPGMSVACPNCVSTHLSLCSVYIYLPPEAQYFAGVTVYKEVFDYHIINSVPACLGTAMRSMRGESLSEDI